jgi:hypothetical protein
VKTCASCGETKPVSEFGPHTNTADGLRTYCKACHAAQAQERRASESPESRAEAMRAYRAGMRKDKCAICGGSVEGYGICSSCQDHVRMLGGLDGLKRAVRAVRYLAE